jgi:pyrroline-5-carboxylate reductase
MKRERQTMNINSIGFIGGGRVTRIFLSGLKAAGVKLSSVVVSDPNAETLGKLKAMFPGITVAGPDNTQPAAQDLVLLAVHPPAIAGVLPGIKGAHRPGAVLVSLAPKFTLAKLSELLGGFNRIARMIPNAPSVMGAGYNPVTFGAGLGASDKQALTGLFTLLGDCPEVAEPKLEAFALLTGMGPTYLWFQLQTLCELALSFGLSDGDITPALKRMVCGAARTLLESGLSPAEVMDLIPVKPLAEDEPAIKAAYQNRLPALFAKIKP